MIILNPIMPASYEPTEGELAEVKQSLAMGAERIEQIMVEQVYENANSGNATLTLRNAVDEAGITYNNMALMVVGAYELNGTRYCLCAGGFSVNFSARSRMSVSSASKFTLKPPAQRQ